MEKNEGIAASTDETEIEDTTDDNTLSATGETESDILDSTTDSQSDGDDEDVTSDSDDGKIDAVKVNEIVKRRVEKVRNKTREEAEAKAAEEIDFWKSKAKEQKVTSAIVNIPVKPVMADYGSNPTQYETDLEKWTQIKSQSEQYTRDIQNGYVARCQEFKKDNADFETSVKFFNSVTVAPAVMSSILESEQGPALAYYLSKNFKQFDRINGLSPISVAREIAKLELKLTGQLKEETPVVKTKVVPKPTKPVSGTAPKSEALKDLVKNDVNKFIAERKKFHARGQLGRG